MLLIAICAWLAAVASGATRPHDDSAPGSRTSPDTSTSCGPAWSPRGDRIAFHSDRAGVTGIYTIDTLGADITPVVADSVWSGYVAWSPDASHLAFSRGPYGHRAIFVATANGQLVRRVTLDSANAHWPAWSADGKSLVFNWDGDGNREIYRVPAAGGAVTRLTFNSAHDDLAKWAPRDTAIVFDSNRDSTWRVFIMRVDGSQQTPIAAGAIPVFSPNGKRIAFQASPLKKGVNIFVMNANGTDRRQLTFGEASDVEPSWSPDGTRIAFCSNRSGRYQIWTMRADGTGLRRLTGPQDSH